MFASALAKRREMTIRQWKAAGLSDGGGWKGKGVAMGNIDLGPHPAFSPHPHFAALAPSNLLS